jgi:hypothetical protein
MPVNLVIRFVEMIIDAFPTEGFEFGYADYNKNGTPDIVLRILVTGRKPLVLGPVDVPAADIGNIFASLSEMFGLNNG